MHQVTVFVVAAVSLTLGCTNVFAQDPMNPQDNAPQQSNASPQGTAPLTESAPSPKTPQALLGKSIQDLSRGSITAAMKDDVKALRRGPLLIHGNYCGLGNRPGTAPTDPLDAACMRHDACTKTGALPSCACDDRLRIEADAIAKDPRTPGDIQLIAAATAASMEILVCKPSPPHSVTAKVIEAPAPQ